MELRSSKYGANVIGVIDPGDQDALRPRVKEVLDAFGIVLHPHNRRQTTELSSANAFFDHPGIEEVMLPVDDDVIEP